MKNTIPKNGLYIHFPFCQKKCAYCDFFSEDYGFDRISKWASSIVTELELLQEQGIDFKNINTIYFGGGSPNLISVDDLDLIISKLRELCKFANIDELTMEMNPGNVKPGFFDRLNKNGIKRLSIGCQSMNDDELKILGRIHNSEDIRNTVTLAKKKGFKNFSLDFIYGIPGQTLESWKDTLHKALNLNVEHFSLYNLIYEPATLLYKKRDTGIIKEINEEIEWQMYDYAHEILKLAGYEHYEVSNWAKPGAQAKHNSIYWYGGKYYGIGPAAHSYNGKIRWWNVRNIDKYISFLQKKKLPIEDAEELGEKEILTEFFLLGLRTSEGINISELENFTGKDFSKIFQEIEKKFNKDFFNKYAKINQKKIKLTHRGWFICDYIISGFLDICEKSGRYKDCKK